MGNTPRSGPAVSGRPSHRSRRAAARTNRNSARRAKRRPVFEALETRRLLTTVGVRFEFDNLSGTALTSLSVGQSFILKTFVSDVSSAPSGVFQSYLNIGYQSTLVSVNGSITHGSDFQVNPDGTTSVAGTLSTVGGETSTFVPPTPASLEQFLFSVPFQVTTASAGSLTLTPSLPLNPQRSTLTYASGGTPVAFGDFSFSITGQPGLSIPILNVAPTVTVNSPVVTKNNKPTLSGTVTDPGGHAITSVNVTISSGGQTVQTVPATVTGTTWTASVPTALADGTYSVSATATDNANNSGSTAQPGTLTVDTVAPTVTVGSLITKNNKPTLTGTVGDAAPSSGIAGVSVVVGGQTLTATVNGTTWSVVVPTALADSTYTVQATATDNASNTTTSTGSLTIDTVAPTATVTALITKNNKPTLTGTVGDAAPSSGIAGVSVVVGGQTLNATVTGATWSVAVPTALANGPFTVQATATDQAGNVSAIATGSLTVDTVAPTVTVSALVTKNNKPTLTGTVGDASPSSGIAGVSVVVGGQTLTATVTGTTWSVAVPTALADGVYTVTATATDNATNSASNTGSLTVDTVVPTVTVNALVTKNNKPTLTGTVIDSSPSSGITGVTVVVGGQTLTAVVTGTTWSAAVPTALADGIYTVTATASDSATNSGSNTGSLTVDTVVPTATVNALVTKNNKPTLTGTVNDAAPSSGIAGVTVVVGGQTLTATVTGTSWSVAVPTALADGRYTVQATATDAAGNSSSTASGALTVDTAAPTVTVNSLVTKNNKPTLTGTVTDAVPSSGIAGVSVVVGGQTLTATVTGTSWSVAIPTALADGVYTVTATATDNATNSSSGTGSVTIDTVAPTVTVNALVTKNNKPTLTGTVGDAAPSSGIASVTVVVGGQTLTATVTAGAWSVAVPTALADGTYTVSATTTDNASNSAGNTGSLTIDTVAPTVTVNALVTKNNKPTLTGTVGDAAPSSGIADVSVVVGGQTLNATVTGTTWSVAIPTALADGTYTITATATDNATNLTSGTASLTIDSVGPAVTVNGLVTKNNKPTLTGTVNDAAPSSGIAGVTVVVGGQTLTATVTGNSWAVVVPTELADGAYTVTATATDNATNTGNGTGSLTIDTVAPTATVNPLVTKNNTPTLTGTVNDAAPSSGIAGVTVVVGGQTLTAMITGSTWSVAVSAALADGNYNVQATATDQAGNSSSVATGSLTVDTVAPTVSVNALVTNNNKPTLTGTVADTGPSSGIAGVTVVVGGQTLTATVTGSTWAVAVPTALADGAFTVTATATDNATNTGNNTGSLTVDTVAPTVTVNSLVTKNNKPTLTGTVNDAAPSSGIASVSVVVGGQTLTAIVTANAWSVAVPTALADGSFTVTATATDSAMNSGGNTGSLTVDTVAPTVTVNSLVTNSSTPTLTGTVNDAGPSSGIAGVSVVVGGQTLAAIVTGNTWSVAVPTALADGPYTIQATSTDQAGNNSVTASGSLTVDTVAPTVAVNSLVTNNNEPTLSGTVHDAAPSSGIAGVTVVVAGQSLTAIVSGTNWSVAVPAALADGTYNVQATATDQAGDTSNAASGSLTVDTVAPTVTVNSLVTKNNEPTLTGTVHDAGPSSGIAGVTVVVGGQTLTAIVTGNTWSAVVPTALADGPFTITATATDNATNAGGNTGSLTVDTVAPTVTVNSLITKNNEPTLTGTVSDAAPSSGITGVSVVVGGQTLTATVMGNMWSAAVPTALADGVFTVTATATDSATNAGGNTGSLTIDTVTPTVTVNTLVTKNNTPTLTGTVNDAAPSSGIAGVTVIVDGQTLTAIVSGATWSAAVPTALADGDYTVTATATDNAANTANNTGSLTIDTVAPTVTVNTLVTKNNTPTLTGTVNDAAPSSGIASVTVIVGGQTLTATVTGATWSVAVPTALADGNYTVQATAADEAGDVSGIATGSLTIDTVNPTVTVNALVTKNNMPTLTGTVSDAAPSSGIASVTVVVSGQTLTAVISGGTWSVVVPTALGDGTITVQATATDEAGNSSSAATGSLTVDTVAPTVTVNSLVTKNSEPTLTGTVNDAAPSSGIANVTVVVGGQTLAATITGATWSVAVPTALADGNFTVQATATDQAGDTSGTATGSLTVDTVAPTVSVNSLVTKTNKPTLTGTVSDAAPSSGLAGVTVVVGGQTLTATITGNTWTVAVPTALVDGTFSVTATATDNAANTGNGTGSLTVDTVAPTVTVNSLVTKNNKPTLTGTVNDAGPSSGIAGVTVLVGGQSLTATVTNNTWSVVVPTALADGAFTVTATATDDTANTASNTGSLTVDTVAPTATVNSLVTKNNKPTLTGTVNDAAPSSGIAGVTVVVGGQTLTAIVTANAWSVAVPTALADGNYSVQVTAADTAGNSSVTATGSLTVDTVNPTVTVTSLVTNHNEPTLAGTVHDASPSSGIASVTIVVGGQTLTATVTASTWSVAIPTALADGLYTVTATATDNATNSAGGSGSLTIDTVDPTVTVNSLVAGNSEPTISGTVNDAAPSSGIAGVTVVVDGQTLTAIVSGTTWSTIPTMPLTDGVYDVQATATDNAGNSGSIRATGALAVDTTVPTATVNSLITNNNRPTLTGTATDLSQGAVITGVTVTVGGQVLTATVTGADWSVAVPTALADGAYTVTATATDNAGKVGSGTGSLGVDTVAPTATVNGLVTNNNKPTLTGTVNDASPSSGIAGVTVVVGGQTLTATVTATAWSVVIPMALADGLYTVTATPLKTRRPTRDPGDQLAHGRHGRPRGHRQFARDEEQQADAHRHRERRFTQQRDHRRDGRGRRTIADGDGHRQCLERGDPRGTGGWQLFDHGHGHGFGNQHRRRHLVR